MGGSRLTSKITILAISELNMEQRKVQKTKKNNEKKYKIEKNKEKSKVDISELGTATWSRGRRATEPGLEDLDPTTGSHVPC